MVGPMLGVRLLSVYGVTMTSGRELDVYCVLAVNHAAPLTLGLFGVSSLREKATASYI